MHDEEPKLLKVRYKIQLEKILRDCSNNLGDTKKCKEAEQYSMYAQDMCDVLSTFGIKSTRELSLQVLRLANIVFTGNTDRADNIENYAHTILIRLCSWLEALWQRNLVGVCWHECGHVMMAHKNQIPSAAVFVDWQNDTYSWAGRRIGSRHFGRAEQEICAGGVAAELYLARSESRDLSAFQLDWIIQRAREDITNYEASSADIPGRLSFLNFATEISHRFNAAEGAIMRRLVSLLIDRKRLGRSVLNAVLNEIEPTIENFKSDEFVLELEAKIFQGYP